MEVLRSEGVTFSDSEAVSTESSVRLSADDDDISESSKIVEFKAPHTLFVAVWIRLMVNGIKILRFKCRGLPNTSHCFVVHSEEMDLVGTHRT